jgi:adiponectin receptor
MLRAAAAAAASAARAAADEHRDGEDAADVEAGRADKDAAVALTIHEADAASPVRHAFALSRVNETPEYLQRPYILGAYRVHFSLPLCARSALRLHNETGNIWTHALGGAALVAQATRDLGARAEMREAGWGDVAVLALFYVAAVACMAASVCFHTFGCHSARAFLHLYRCDVTAIGLLILGSYVPGLYYAFACQPAARALYISVIVALCALAMTLPWRARGAHGGDHTRSVAVLVALVVFSVLPILHWWFGPSRETGVDRGRHLSNVAHMLVLYGAGLVVYRLHLPERLLPGRFDCWLHSHQIWHVFVYLAARSWPAAIADMVSDNRAHPCPSAPLAQ